jgi:uncharacterized membrane protein
MRKWQDKDMQLIIGNLLRGGVLLSTVIVIIGGIIYLYRHGGQYPEYRTFHSQPIEFRTITGIFQSAWGGRGRGYLVEKDYLYVAITLLVLCIILFSMLGGKAG